jgi:hypothetical protein
MSVQPYLVQFRQDISKLRRARAFSASGILGNEMAEAPAG